MGARCEFGLLDKLQKSEGLLAAKFMSLSPPIPSPILLICREKIWEPRVLWDQCCLSTATPALWCYKPQHCLQKNKTKTSLYPHFEVISVSPAKAVLGCALLVRRASCGLQVLGSAQLCIPIIKIWVDFFSFKWFILLYLPSLFPWACLFLHLAESTRDEIGAEDVNYVIIWAKTYCVMGREEKWQGPYMRKLNPMLGFLIKVLIFTVLPVVTGDLRHKGEEFYFLFAFI